MASVPEGPNPYNPARQFQEESATKTAPPSDVRAQDQECELPGTAIWESRMPAKEGGHSLAYRTRKPRVAEDHCASRSAISHTRSVRPASIAGVTRSVL